MSTVLSIPALSNAPNSPECRPLAESVFPDVPLTSACHTDDGIEVIDLDHNDAFNARHLHIRDVATQIEGMRRLASAFVDRPDTVLQELVNAAVSLCGADSAGISVVREQATAENFYHWIATAGEYSGFLDAVLPEAPSACGVCLDRNRPQLMRVSQRFFDITGVVAATVTDGLLLPWQVDQTRGTIWILAHGRTEAFDSQDLQLMQTLANFAAMAIRQLRQQKLLLEQAQATASANMANELAHHINNPLQSITNLLYLALESDLNPQTQQLASDLTDHVERLSELVTRLLALPRMQPM